MNIETSRQSETRRRKTRQHRAVKFRDETIVRLFGELRRVRVLDDDEKALFDRALLNLGPKREVWRWSEQEDRQLLNLIRRRAEIGRPAPFKVNREVIELAESLGRSYFAVHRRIERLRKREKCSSAKLRRKG